MFRLVLSKETREHVVPLKVSGISRRNSTVVWGTPIEYQIAKKFVDGLNENGLSEDELFDVTLDFLVENLDQMCTSKE